MADPIRLLAMARVVKLSADLEIDLLTKPSGGIVVELLREFKDRAAESLEALAFADPNNAEAIRVLQNEVKRYDEFFVEVRALIQRGKVYDRDLGEEGRDQLLNELLETEGGEQRAAEMGLIAGGPLDPSP